MMRKLLYIISVYILSTSNIFAQQYTVSATRGTIYLPDGWAELLGGATTGADVSVSWPVIHEQGHRLPYRMGLKANYAHIPNGIAGDRFNLSGFARTPLLSVTPFGPGPSSHQAGELSMEFGTGLGMYSKPLSYTRNFDNQYITTFLNCVIDLGLVYTQPVADKGALVLGGKFIHNSNGFFAKPNMGLNFWEAQLGWQFDSKPVTMGEGRTLSFSEKYDARTGGFVAVAPGLNVPRSSLAHNGELSPAYTVQLGWRYAYQRCRSIALSMDLAYNFSDDYDLRKAGEPTPFPMFVALAATHETHWGPVSMRLGVGYHIIESFECKRLYERAGVFYNFFTRDGRHQFAGVAIKASFARADFIEWTYGIDLW